VRRSCATNSLAPKQHRGVEFAYTISLGMAAGAGAEWECYRISDKINVNLISGSLLYRF